MSLFDNKFVNSRTSPLYVSITTPSWINSIFEIVPVSSWSISFTTKEKRGVSSLKNYFIYNIVLKPI